jgi:MoaA/NifB/PqqE/SkfB family radical SAM enzyme
MSFDITNKCNFRCLHCYNRSGENPVIERELTDDEILEFANDLVNLKLFNLCFCGGEPLLRFELMCKVAQILSTSGSRVSFVSNGSLITEEVARKLLVHGVTAAQISLDGDNPISHERLRGVKGSFTKAVNAIRILKEVGFPKVDVAFCPTRWNIGEIENVFFLCKELRITRLRVQPLMPLGRGKENAEFIVPTPLQYRELVRKINYLKKEYSTSSDTTIEWGDPVDHLIRLPTILRHCSTLAEVRADGSIEVSPYLPITVGNIRRHKFSEYWSAGLVRVWEIPKLQELATRIVSVKDMGRNDKGVPTVWFDEDITIDIIDDNIFGGPNERSKTSV